MPRTLHVSFDVQLGKELGLARGQRQLRGQCQHLPARRQHAGLVDLAQRVLQQLRRGLCLASTRGAVGGFGPHDGAEAAPVLVRDEQPRQPVRRQHLGGRQAQAVAAQRELALPGLRVLRGHQRAQLTQLLRCLLRKHQDTQHLGTLHTQADAVARQ